MHPGGTPVSGFNTGCSHSAGSRRLQGGKGWGLAALSSVQLRGQGVGSMAAAAVCSLVWALGYLLMQPGWVSV